MEVAAEDKPVITTVADRLYYFFFSSRRRHTRLQGDWSSDVCSSDLIIQGWEAASTTSDQMAGSDLGYINRDLVQGGIDVAKIAPSHLVGDGDQPSQIGRASCRERV